MNKSQIKRLAAHVGKACATVAVMAVMTTDAYADTGITNPLSGNSASASNVINNVVGWVIGAVEAIAAAFFLFHLYKAIIGLIAGSHHAQKREEAKSHLVYVAISGVLLGGGAVLAAALYGLGSSIIKG